MTSIIYGERIRQARECCGYTQTALAKQVGTTQSAIAHIENDRNTPTTDLLNKIAIETGFKPSFFEQEPISDFSLGTLSYRARKSLSAKEESQAYQCARTIYEHVKKMAQRLDLPNLKLDCPEESTHRSARIVRSSLGTAPDMPIPNLVNLLERNGFIIITLPLILPKIDAFSTWATVDTERPIILLSSGKPNDRMRFSIAHELGHLTIHRVTKGRMHILENEANAFASEFLMPESAIKNDLLPPVSLTTVAKLKPKWGVSMAALIYRARSLNVITDRQYRYLFEQLSARGWRKREPENLDLPHEKPQALRKMVETLFGDAEEYAEEMLTEVARAREMIVFW